jgi:hypothetical protein
MTSEHGSAVEETCSRDVEDGTRQSTPRGTTPNDLPTPTVGPRHNLQMVS